jgi:hypothetical protein
MCGSRRKEEEEQEGGGGGGAHPKTAPRRLLRPSAPRRGAPLIRAFSGDRTWLRDRPLALSRLGAHVPLLSGSSAGGFRRGRSTPRQVCDGQGTARKYVSPGTGAPAFIARWTAESLYLRLQVWSPRRRFVERHARRSTRGAPAPIERMASCPPPLRRSPTPQARSSRRARPGGGGRRAAIFAPPTRHSRRNQSHWPRSRR